MRKKIYNKKGFFSGIIILLLATILIITMIIKDYHQMSNMKIQLSQPYFSFFEIAKNTPPIRHKGIPMITTLPKL